jgi:hypothetical protein
MTLRLVLVGIVAALGVTLPNEPECEIWFGAAENWAISVLADWDTWRPNQAGDDSQRRQPSIHDCVQCRLARASLDANPHGTSVKLDDGENRPLAALPYDELAATVLADNLVLGPLEELCRRVQECVAESTTNRIVVRSPEDSAQSAARSQVSAERSHGSGPAASIGHTDGWALDCYVGTVVQYGPDLFDAIEHQWDQCDKTTLAPSREVAVSPCILAASKTNAAVISPTPAQSCAARAVSPPKTDCQTHVHQPASVGIPWPVFATIEPTARTETELACAASVPWPVFAPVDATPARENGIAVQPRNEHTATLIPPQQLLGHATGIKTKGPTGSLAAESLALVRNTSEKRALAGTVELDSRGPEFESSQELHWAQAVRLTREAACAWMKVFAGPARVQLTAR